MAGTARRSPGGSRAAGRPAAPRRPQPSRRRGALPRAGRSGGGARRRRPAERRDAVHGPARRLEGAALALHRRRRPADRHADREPPQRRGRGPDRLLRQHPGAAHRPLGRSGVFRSGGAGAARDAGRLRPPGRAVRAAGGGAAAGAEPLAHAAVPGDGGAAERAAAGARHGGPRRAPPGAAAHQRQVRPDADAGAGGRRPRRLPGLCRRSLRPRHGRASGRPLPASAGGGRGCAGGAPVGPAAPRRGGAAPAPWRVERHPRAGRSLAGSVAGRSPPALRRPGGELSRGGGPGVGGGAGEPHLRRARPARQPARAPPARARRRAGHAGRPAGRAHAGDDRRPAGHPEGGRRLCAARSAAAGGAAGLRAGRRPGSSAADPGKLRRGCRCAGSARGPAGRGPGRDRQAQRGRSRRRGPAGPPGLRHLHFGDDRRAQGHHDPPRRGREPARSVGAVGLRGRGGSAARQRQRAAGLRRLGQAVDPAAAGPHAGAGAGRGAG